MYIAKLATFAQALLVTAYMVASYYFDFSNKQLADRKLGDGQLVRLGIDLTAFYDTWSLRVWIETPFGCGYFLKPTFGYQSPYRSDCGIEHRSLKTIIKIDNSNTYPLKSTYIHWLVV